MAVTTDSLLVNVSVNTENAAKSLDALTKEFANLKASLASVGKDTGVAAKSLGDVGTLAVKLQAGLSLAKTAYEQVSVAVKESIKAFTEDDHAMRRLGYTLETTGELSRSVFEDFKEFASNMQESANVADDVVISMLSTAKAIGLTNNESKKLVQASADMAAALGGDVQSAMEQLLGQFSGVPGRVAKMIPALKDLTEEELRAGKGIDLVAAKFKGFAERDAATLEGAAKRADLAWGDLQEAIGQVAVEIVNLQEKQAATASTLKDLTKWVLENKDTWVALGKTVISIGLDAFNGLKGIVLDTGRAFVNLGAMATRGIAVVAKGLASIGVISDETWLSIEDLRQELEATTDTLGNKAQMAFADIGDTGSSAMLDIKDAAYEVDDALKGTVKTANTLGGTLGKAAKEAEKALEDLKKKITDLRAENAKLGANEGEIVRQRLDATNLEITGMETKLRLAGQLTAANRELLKQARDLAYEGSEKELALLRKKNLEELLKGNRALFLEVNAENMSTRDLIAAQTKEEIYQLEVKAQSLELEEAGRRALEEQIDLLKKRGELAAAKAPSAEYESIERGGKKIAEQISGVFTQGALDMVGGMAAGVGAIVSAANAVLDMIPNMINSIADLGNKITDFPETVLKAFQNLSASLKRLVADFIPNLLKGIPEIVDTILETVAKVLPDAILSLIDSLPDLIDNFIKRVPEIVEQFVETLIPNMPRIAISLMESMTKDAPRLAIELAKAMAITLPKAIIKGLIDGLKQAGGVIKDALFGRGLKVPFDTKELVAATKSLGRTLSGEASKLFAVLDADQAAKSAENVRNIAAQIEDGFKKGGNWLKDLWDGLIKGLLDAWRWVYENIIKPIEEILIRAWRWVWENVIQPIAQFIKDAWDWVMKNVITPLIDGLKAAWDFINTTIIQPFIALLNSAWGAAKEAFKWVEDNIVTPLTGIGKTAFTWVKEKIITPLTDWKLPKWSWPDLPKFTWPEFHWPAFSFSWPTFSFSWPKIEFSWPAIPEPAWLKKLSGGGGGGGGILPFATGGMVPLYAAGGVMVPRGTDTVPAMLTPGEFVVNRRAVSRLGAPAMQQINSGMLPMGSTTTNVDLKLNIQTEQPIDERFVRSKLMPMLKEELKRAGLDGKRVLPAQGVY